VTVLKVFRAAPRVVAGGGAGPMSAHCLCRRELKAFCDAPGDCPGSGQHKYDDDSWNDYQNPGELMG